MRLLNLVEEVHGFAEKVRYSQALLQGVILLNSLPLPVDIKILAGPLLSLASKILPNTLTQHYLDTLTLYVKDLVDRGLGHLDECFLQEEELLTKHEKRFDLQHLHQAQIEVLVREDYVLQQHMCKLDQAIFTMALWVSVICIATSFASLYLFYNIIFIRA